MTDEEMRVAIAEAIGWKRVPCGCGCGELLWRHDVYSATMSSPQDFLNDLNAMWEVERQLVLTMARTSIPLSVCSNEASEYFRHLIKACGDWNPIHATARQKAVAFLRTIGKWRD